MECKQAEALFVAYARGELAEAPTCELEAHLASCGACQWNAGAARATLETLKQAAQTDVVAMVDDLISTAIDRGASDIHVEPQRDGTRVRIRIDGVLHEVARWSRVTHAAAVARLLVMAEADPYEKRSPQIGRIGVLRGDSAMDLRVTALPSCFGQHLTLRIIAGSSVHPDLAQTGMADPHLCTLRQLLRRPCGLIALVGPAGSGKTTLAYACLQEINHPGISAFTVEDPAAVLLDGVTQMHINQKAGLEYPQALRAVLQADPDVVFVGNLHDQATGTGVMELALTGHLVLSCFHAQDAPQGVAHLLSLGLDPAMLAAGLLGVVSQRLVRRVCECCKEQHPLPPDETAFLHCAGLTAIPPTGWRGVGCDQCRQTGYKGRTAVHEILVVDEPLMGIMAEGHYTPELGRRLVGRSMVLDAAERAAAGVTTVTEARRVTASAHCPP